VHVLRARTSAIGHAVIGVWTGRLYAKLKAIDVLYIVQDRPLTELVVVQNIPASEFLHGLGISLDP
jgi:hypothetical protein